MHRRSRSLIPLFATVVFGCGTAMPPQESAQEADVVYGTRVHKMPKLDDSAPRPFSAPAGAHLTYYGGRVISNVQVVQVLWGTGSYLSQVTSTATPSMGTFYQQATNSAYFSWLTEYNTTISGGTNQVIGSGSFAGQFTITPSTTATTISDATIQSELVAQINAGHLPAPTTDAAGNVNTYYAIFFPHGKTITQGGSSSCVSGGFCAYHGTLTRNSQHLYYGVHPDMQSGSGCDTGCGGSATAFNNYTSVASHELVEATTDAEVGLATVLGAPLAWYDNTNGEIGDICNAQQGTIVGGDGVTYTVQKEFSNTANDCIVSRTTTNDFSISASPNAVSVTAGSSVSTTITTATTSGSAQTVSLTATAPTGYTVTFSPSSVTSGGSSTMTVSTSSTAASGTVTVRGTAASGSHTASVTVTVNGVPTNDFSISASPNAVSVTAGGAVTSTISTATTSGSAQTVSLSASAPAGYTVSFSPTSVTSGSSSTMTISTSSTAASGTVTVTGTATSGSHTTSVSVTVSGGGGGGGAIVNGDFETGSLSGWTATGASESVVSSGCHGGSFCARLGSTVPTNGDSSIAQTFTAPSGTTGITFFYKMTCPDSVTYDWATATLRDNTAGTTATLLSRICQTNSSYVQVNGSITAGHSYTLTLTSHDDNYSSDPSYTLYDDVALTTTAPPPPPPTGITNGGFETGSFSGWTFSGASHTITTTAHSGSYAALLGSTSPTNGDSTISQTFTAPSGVTRVSLYYANNCPDTVTYDWVTVTLRDNTAGTTATLVPRTCASSYVWTNVTGAVTAGHSYTLSLTSHDDNYSADPTYTLFDDVVLQ